jgi:hypothetical protein
MTIYKHLQTDGTGNWFLHLFAKLFKIQCKSHVDQAQSGPLRCSLWYWHSCKHHDRTAGIVGVRWCYGDEFFE